MSKIEQLVDRACREQPALEAPPTLSARVLAELQRRAALPWWRRTFAHWPVPVRAIFVAACGAVIGGSLSPPIARLLTAVDEPVTWAYRTEARVSSMNAVFGHVGTNLANSVSPLWLYGAALGVCGLYVLFAALCATTYRTLYIAR
jgi:hypothetical protein